MLRKSETLSATRKNAARILTVLLLAATAFVPAAGAQEDGMSTLERIEARGLVQCGVIRSGIGVSEIDNMGRWKGFFPEFCHAIAAAILNDREAVEFVEVNYVVRFEALQSGAFDVLMANTTWTASRDTNLDLAFTHPIYYDGQGFLAHKNLGASSLADVDDASVCVSENTTTIHNLEDLVRTRMPGLRIQAYESIESVYSSFFSGECDMMTQDRVALVSQLLNRASDPDEFVLFEDVISKEPLGPVVREGDEKWLDIVQWVVFALMIAEEYGITHDNVGDFMNSTKPEIRRLLGLENEIGEMLGLPKDWGYRAISATGSYGEIFERNLGSESPLDLQRGLNALWTDGGLIYAPPLR